MPIRIQRKRTKGWKMPPNTVSVCRPGEYGNPFKVGDYLSDVPFIVLSNTEMTEEEQDSSIITQDLAVKLHKTWLFHHRDGHWILARAIANLQGKNLACFCPLDKPCHADTLLEIVNK